MCGIFGHIGHLDRSIALSCVHSMAHRGPDDWGLEAYDGCLLGHRRLSILDTSDAGTQPMISECGRYAIVYNGEVYNYVEIRRELEMRGHVFRTGTDTEVVLAAYAEYGPACLDRFNGMWALAIWDRSERRLFLARDRFGKKPLFWAMTPTGFAFASEMKGLLPLLPAVTPHPELTTSSRRIMSYEATDECLITEIRRFPAGHYGLTRGQEPTLSRWWNTLDHIEPLSTPYEERVEAFRELFLDACRIRMRSDVPLGTALSGGLDSSSTICAMDFVAKHMPPTAMGGDWQHAFTASFPGTPIDEARFAHQVTDHLGIPAVTLVVDPTVFPATISRDLWLFEEMHLTPPTPFMRTYESVRSHGVKVTLDGHGADEMFAGYGFDFLHAMHDASPTAWPGIGRVYRESLPDGPQFPKPSTAKLILSHLKNRMKRIPSPAYESPDGDHPAWQAMGRLNRILYHSFHQSILPTLLRNYDRYSMAAGVEVRMPFMDHRIVSLAFSLPWDSKLRSGFSKALVRDGVKTFVPETIVRRKAKIGFNAPCADWIRGPLREYFLDALHSSDFRTSQLVNPDLAGERLNNLLDTETPTFAQAEACWTAFVPFFWEEAVLKGKGAPACA